MKKIIFFFLPLFLFGFYEFSLKKEVDFSEFIEEPFLNCYYNPALLTELKEKYLGFEVYHSNGTSQVTSLIFLNNNKLLSYALILKNYENGSFSERSLDLILAKRKKDYSYGLKFQVGKIKDVYEELFNYEIGDYTLEREGPIFDSSANYFSFEDGYDLERNYERIFNFNKNERKILYFPFAFYVKTKNLEIGFDFKNSQEKRINKEERENKELEEYEEYYYEKEGDTTLKRIEEDLTREIDFYQHHTRNCESLNIITKDVSLFLKKTFRGIRDKEILFTRFGYFNEITKGSYSEMKFDSTYDFLMEWYYFWDEGEESGESTLVEEGKGILYEKKREIFGEKEKIYQEGGFGFSYYFPFLKIDNTIFLGIKEKFDLIKMGKDFYKRIKFIFHLGNNFEKGSFSFFPIFLPSFIIDEDKQIIYNHYFLFNGKLKLLDFLNFRFSYFLPKEKDESKKLVLGIYLNY